MASRLFARKLPLEFLPDYHLTQIRIERKDNGFGFTLRHFIVYPPEVRTGRGRGQAGKESRLILTRPTIPLFHYPTIPRHDYSTSQLFPDMTIPLFHYPTIPRVREKNNCPLRFFLSLILSTRVLKYYLVNFATEKRVLCLWHRQVIK